MSALTDAVVAAGPGGLAAGGFAIGAAFGVITHRTNFCTMGALVDATTFGDWRRFRAWMLAVGVAILGTASLGAIGVVDLARSMYLAPTLTWAGHLLGGLMFGVGMVLAGGCASKNLSRAGSGDLRALLTLVVLGIAAFITIGGILAPARLALDAATVIDLKRYGLSTQAMGLVLAPLLPRGAAADLILAVLMGAGLVAWTLGSAAFRASPMHVASGVGVGLCVVAGWALTGLADDEFAARPMPPISLTFVRPTGDALEWLQRYTAGPIPGFGVATVFGALAGAAVSAWSSGRFRLTTFAGAADTRRSLLGAILMGVGGVLALGCTVGQAITGLSTLAVGSVLTFAAILAGGRMGIAWLERMLADDEA
jgi:uncharacterized membrane protein YedE/YeeE